MMNLSELLQTVRRVEVRTSRLLNDTKVGLVCVPRVLTPFVQRGNRKA
jgi:hypothetical protein